MTEEVFANMLNTLQRPPISSLQLTPPSAQQSSFAHSPHSSNPPIWPSIFGVLETPERKRVTAAAVQRRQQQSSSSTGTFNQYNNNFDNQMLWNNDRQSRTDLDFGQNEDSGLGDSYLDISTAESSMILRPSPVLRTPFVTNTKNLQSPLRAFFFKPSPPAQNEQLPSLTKSENAIGVRFNGTQLVHLKSPCLLSTIQNQNNPPITGTPSSIAFNKRISCQRSPLKPCQSSRNLNNDLTWNKNSNVETPSKGVKLEFGFDGLSPFVSPLKFSQPFSSNYNDSFLPDHTNGFMEPSSMDMFEHHFGSQNYLNSSSFPISNNNTSSPRKSTSFKNDSLSSFSLSLNSTNESSLIDSSTDMPGSMSCSKAIRIKVPRFSSRTKALIYGRTQAQREITRQANHYWKRNCPNNYQTQMPLCETLEEFSKLEWQHKKTNLPKSLEFKAE